MDTIQYTTENTTHYCVAFERTSMTDTAIHLGLQKILRPIILFNIITTFFHLVLQRLGQLVFVSQMITGIILGPSFIGYNKRLDNQMFSPLIASVVNFLDWFGMVYMTFSVCARIDIGIIRKAGRLALIIGIGSSLIPIFVTAMIAHSVKNDLQLDDHLRLVFHIVGALNCTVNFPVVLSILTDLNILNSELGRLTLSSSLISGTLGLVMLAVIGNYMIDTTRLSPLTTWLKHLSLAVMITFAIYAIRPMMKRMMNQTPEGKPLRHGHVLVIHLMVLGYSLFGEVTSHHAVVGVIVLGLAAPASPPMGYRLTEKIEHVVWAVCIPCFAVNVGREMDLFSIERHHVFAVELVALIGMVIKSFTIMIPSLYYKIPLMDAISLTLILNTRGMYDVHHHKFFHELKLITKESFIIMVINSMLQSAIFIPIVRYIYDSSRRFVAYRRRTVQHSRNQAELRVIACIHEPDDVATIVNILQASNHPGSPVGIYVMKLEEYVGRFIPVVIAHRLDQISSDRNSKVNRMINIFHHYERENKDHVYVQCFTAIAPYATMHDDICLMAFEKSASLVIIPFQKSNTSFSKNVVKNLLNLAPCSVGIFYDRGTFMNPRPIFSWRITLKVCVVFIGGPDDREALAYGLRMAEHHKVLLQVIRFTDMNQANTDMIEERKQDFSMINDLRASAVDSINIKYLEENVTEGSHTIWILNSMGNDFDLILVGRSHNSESKVLSGLREWNEVEECGLIGDILISSDFRGMASIMVIQQQASVVQRMIEGPRYSFK